MLFAYCEILFIPGDPIFVVFVDGLAHEFKISRIMNSISNIIVTIFKLLPILGLVGWLVVLRINVDLAIFQPYVDLEAGDNQSLKIQVARPGIEPRSSCSASQELNHSATTAPSIPWV